MQNMFHCFLLACIERLMQILHFFPKLDFSCLVLVRNSHYLTLSLDLKVGEFGAADFTEQMTVSFSSPSSALK